MDAAYCALATLGVVLAAIPFEYFESMILRPATLGAVVLSILFLFLLRPRRQG